MKAIGKTIITVAVAATIILPLLILKGCGSQWNGVSVNLALTSSDASAPVEQLAIPPGVMQIAFTISGEGMDTINRTINVDGATSVSETFEIQPGPQRSFNAQALDRSGATIWNGTTEADIGEQPVTIAIVMEFMQSQDTEPPTMPTMLSLISGATGSITLSWQPSEDNNTVAGYYIYEVLDALPFLINSVAVTYHTESDLRPGIYCRTVTAIDPAGNESAMPEPVCIFLEGPVDQTKPSSPQGLIANAISESAIEITWEPPADVTNVAGYNIYNSGSAARYVSSATGTSIIDIRLMGGIYCYNATSVDTLAEESDPVGPVCVTLTGIINGPVEDTVEPTVPADLFVNTTSTTGMEIAWSPSSDNNAVAGYNIYEDDDGTTKFRTSSIANSISLERLSPGYYCFALSAVDASGNESAQCETACVLLGGSAYDPRVPNCPEFLTFMTNPGGQYRWQPDSNPPKCYGELPPPPKTWWKTPPGQSK